MLSLGRIFFSPCRSSHTLASLHRGLATDDLFHPTEAHRHLRSLCADFAEKRIAPQAAEFDEKGYLNKDLLREVGGLGLLGITIPEKDGGVGLDAIASCIVHHEVR
jgi:isovaleryl-CoA dehydrogenase